MPQPGTSGMEPSFGDAYGNHRCFLILEPCTISPLGSGPEYEEKGMVLMLGSPATTRKRPFELLSDLVDDGFSEDLHHERWDVSALDDIAQCSKESLEGELVISEGTLTAKTSRSMEGLTEQAGSLSGQQAQGSPKTEIMAGSDSEARVQENSPEAEITEVKPPPLEQRYGEHNYSLQAEPSLGSGTESGDTEEEVQGAAVETTADVNSRFSGPECGPDSQVFRHPKKRRCFWEYSQGHVAESKREGCRQSLCWSSTTLPSTLYLREGMARKGKKYPRKARKTDASDLTPNPQKLCTIGEQLHKLNAAIEGMTPANDLPIVARARSRKEKNKLASRACRLKKKAQHEANKIKLWGLNQEYENLLRALQRIKEVIRRRVEISKADNEMGMTDTLESILKESAGPRVAGQTKEFVERILESNAVSLGALGLQQGHPM